MKIEKTPSGKWQVRKMYKGKSYQIKYDVKPKLSQAELDMAELISKKDVKSRNVSKITVEDACRSYITTKTNVLSPSTIRGYTKYTDNLDQEFRSTYIDQITEEYMQIFVNNLSKDHSPKYVKNVYNFVTSSLKMFIQGYSIHSTLPKQVVMTYYEPSDDDVQKLIQASYSTNYYIPLVLGIYGVSKSEMCAVRASDIHGQMLTINKAKVQDKDGNWIIKNSSKTDTRNRIIAVPQFVADYIVEHDYAYNGHPNEITKWMYRQQRILGIQKFSQHKLRHYFVAKMDGKVSESTLLEMGGWKTDRVMKDRYRYNLMREEEQKKNISDILFNSVFNS